LGGLKKRNVEMKTICLILRWRQTPVFRTGSKTPLSINPEQTPGFRLGLVEGLILGMTIFLCALESEAKDFKFPEMPGWNQSGEVQTFIPKTLYEYIDGAADLYFSYDFEELKVVEYVNDRKASVIIDVYRHATPRDAFGIYSQERLPNANYLDTGIQGYYEKNALNVLSGNYYVKISSFKTGADDQEILIAFANKVSANLGEKGALPPILTAFPKEGKVTNSEKFISKKFLGYAFLHSAFTADYALADKKFRLFIIESGDPRECRNMIQTYLEQTGKTEAKVAEGRHTISDPHHGEIDLYWRGGNVWGILNLNDLVLRSKYLRLLEEGLKKKK
jgi:hypothetical protein